MAIKNLQGGETEKDAIPICSIVERVWTPELTRGELAAIGVDVSDRKWQRLFGKRGRRANYYFCNSCYCRHVAVPSGDDKFLGVDENGECDVICEFPGDDLKLFAFEKEKFLGDLQRNAFDLNRERIEEIIPNICWQVGTFLGEIKVYFVHKSFQLPLEAAVAKTIVAVQREGKSIEQFILLVLNELLLSNEIKLMVEARKGYIVCLEKLLYFDERRQLQSRQSLQTVLKKLVQFCNANEKEALWEKCMASETEVNSKWKELHPGSSAPFPYTILLMIDKDGMSIKDVCKKYNVGKTKLHEMLRFARERTDDVVRRHKNRYPTPSLIEDAEKCDTSM